MSGSNEPDLYPESFHVTLKSEAAMVAKSLMCIRKKLQRPTNDILTLVGVSASLIACSLFHPGLIPCGVNVKPR